MIHLIFATIFSLCGCYYSDEIHSQKHVLRWRYIFGIRFIYILFALGYLEELLFRKELPYILSGLVNDEYVVLICSTIFALCHIFNHNSSATQYYYRVLLSHLTFTFLMGYHFHSVDNIYMSTVHHFLCNFIIHIILMIRKHVHMYLHPDCKKCSNPLTMTSFVSHSKFRRSVSLSDLQDSYLIKSDTRTCDTIYLDKLQPDVAKLYECKFHTCKNKPLNLIKVD